MIRALSASETNEQREVEKAKLEKEYKRSDQRLDELVSLHDQDLTEVMKVSININYLMSIQTINYNVKHENTQIFFRCRSSVICQKGLQHRVKKFMQLKKI